MPSLEVDELIILIMTIFPLLTMSFVARKNHDVIKWIPTFFCLFLVFLFTNIEALALPDEFNFCEHLFSMLFGISMCLAAIYEFMGSFLKKIKDYTIKNKIEGYK